MPKIEQLGERWRAAAQRAKALGEPNQAERERIKIKLTEYNEKNQSRMKANGAKLFQYRFLFEARRKSLGELGWPSWLSAGETPRGK